MERYKGVNLPFNQCRAMEGFLGGKWGLFFFKGKIINTVFLKKIALEKLIYFDLFGALLIMHI